MPWTAAVANNNTAEGRVAAVLAGAASAVWSRGLARALADARRRAAGEVARRSCGREKGRHLGDGGGGVEDGKAGKGTGGGQPRGGWVNGVQATNLDRYLTWGPRLGCLPTADLDDRAHGVRDAAGGLMRGARVANAAPRLYPRSALNGAGVAVDTVAERLDARQRRLAEEGLAVGGCGNVAEHVHAVLGKLEAAVGRDGLRRAIDLESRRKAQEVES